MTLQRVLTPNKAKSYEKKVQKKYPQDLLAHAASFQGKSIEAKRIFLPSTL
jgi:hypothetical protein